MEEPGRSLSRFVAALYFSAEKHKDQRRKNEQRTPYINHPVELAYILAEKCGVFDADVLAAAVLHDTLEDTDAQPEDIEKNFGSRVLTLVLEVTDDKRLVSKERKLKQLEKASTLSHEARMIRIADKISNVSDLISSPPAGWNRKRKLDYVNWTADVVKKVKGTHPLLEKLYWETYKEAVLKI